MLKRLRSQCLRFRLNLKLLIRLDKVSNHLWPYAEPITTSQELELILPTKQSWGPRVATVIVTSLTLSRKWEWLSNREIYLQERHLKWPKQASDPTQPSWMWPGSGLRFKIRTILTWKLRSLLLSTTLRLRGIMLILWDQTWLVLWNWLEAPHWCKVHAIARLLLIWARTLVWDSKSMRLKYWLRKRNPFWIRYKTDEATQLIRNRIWLTPKLKSSPCLLKK